MVEAAHLEVALAVKEQILGLDIAVCDTLAVKVGDATQNLLEATFDFHGRHPSFLDGGVQIPSGTKLHDLAPMQILVLHQVDGLHDVDVMERRRDTELGSELLDILLLCLVLPPFPELLHGDGSVSERASLRDAYNAP